MTAEHTDTAADVAALRTDLAAMRLVLQGIEGKASCTCAHRDDGRTDSRGCGRHFLLALLDDNAATRRDLAVLRERAGAAEAKVAAVAALEANYAAHPRRMTSGANTAADLRAAVADRPAGGES